MLCDRCGVREASRGRRCATIDTTGSEIRWDEHLCLQCVELERKELEAREAEARASLHDGSFFEQVRNELHQQVDGKDPDVHAQAAVFLDLLRDNLEVPLPQDLIDFANRHRRPQA